VIFFFGKYIIILSTADKYENRQMPWAQIRAISVIVNALAETSKWHTA